MSAPLVAGASELRASFPTRVLALSLLLTALILGGLVYSVRSINVTVTRADARFLRAARLQGTIIHLDEVLTMSARMAALTGDGQWERRYPRARGRARCGDQNHDARQPALAPAVPAARRRQHRAGGDGKPRVPGGARGPDRPGAGAAVFPGLPKTKGDLRQSHRQLSGGCARAAAARTQAARERRTHRAGLRADRRAQPERGLVFVGARAAPVARRPARRKRGAARGHRRVGTPTRATSGIGKPLCAPGRQYAGHGLPVRAALRWDDGVSVCLAGRARDFTASNPPRFAPIPR